MYDIYLYSGCDSTFNISEIDSMLPSTENDQFTQKITMKIPGFLGLNLEKDTVINILKILGKYKAGGIYTPSRYRNPTVTRDFALDIGNRERIRLSEEFPELTFYQPHINPRHILWWEVSIGCKEWMDEGDLPGAIILCVDKCDGHVWEESDVNDFIRDQPLKRIAMKI
jgi:hypothetical protein